jgi:pilus assembly protein CpaB
MNRKLIIVGAIAVLAFGGAYAFMRSAANPAPSPSAEAQPKVDVEQVLVAGQDLPMGTVVNEGAVSWHPWPKADVSELMITKSAKPDALSDVEGSMTRTAFLRGEPIRRDKLVKAGAGGFMSAILPTGKRAVAIKIDNEGDSEAGGFILPNDRVDVILSRRDREAERLTGIESQVAETLLSNIKVLAIDQNVEDKSGRPMVGRTATLELSPRQVETLAMGRLMGTLSLALRSVADSDPSRRGPAPSPDNGGAGRLNTVRFGVTTTTMIPK